VGGTAVVAGGDHAQAGAEFAVAAGVVPLVAAIRVAIVGLAEKPKTLTAQLV
jgi:hypothetical protein